MARSQHRKLNAPRVEERARTDEERVRSRRTDGVERRVDLVAVSDLEELDLKPKVRSG